MNDIVAVSWSDFEKFGCIKCGCDYCYTGSISGGGTSPVTCGECAESFVILADGLNQSRMGFGGSDGDPAHYPDLREHPRKGIPKHAYARPDVKPETGGEYWAPRGIGYDLSGFVKSKEAGARIVKMVETVIGRTPKTWLDYRPHEPKWIQVKVQARDGIDLEKLHELCRTDGIITEDRVKRSMPTGGDTIAKGSNAQTALSSGATINR